MPRYTHANRAGSQRQRSNSDSLGGGGFRILVLLPWRGHVLRLALDLAAVTDEARRGDAAALAEHQHEQSDLALRGFRLALDLDALRLQDRGQGRLEVLVEH